jgi:hypothetical protein
LSITHQIIKKKILAKKKLDEKSYFYLGEKNSFFATSIPGFENCEIFIFNRNHQSRIAFKEEARESCKCEDGRMIYKNSKMKKKWHVKFIKLRALRMHSNEEVFETLTTVTNRGGCMRKIHGMQSVT